MAKDFVHLHLHSEYSLLDGACRITEIADRVKECGQSAVAITDHGNTVSWRFTVLAKRRV